MRVENNESQTLKTRYQRFENIDGIFTLNHKEHLEYKHIILIDDVYTSGATISGCIQVLSHVKGITISIVCIAS
jgi:predicted amidophosphoribosyltransferase